MVLFLWLIHSFIHLFIQNSFVLCESNQNSNAFLFLSKTDVTEKDVLHRWSFKFPRKEENVIKTILGMSAELLGKSQKTNKIPCGGRNPQKILWGLLLHSITLGWTTATSREDTMESDLSYFCRLGRTAWTRTINSELQFLWWEQMAGK